MRIHKEEVLSLAMMSWSKDERMNREKEKIKPNWICNKLHFTYTYVFIMHIIYMWDEDDTSHIISLLFVQFMVAPSVAVVVIWMTRSISLLYFLFIRVVFFCSSLMLFSASFRHTVIIKFSLVMSFSHLHFDAIRNPRHLHHFLSLVTLIKKQPRGHVFVLDTRPLTLSKQLYTHSCSAHFGSH